MKRYQTDENGLVAIIVATMIMIIMSLVVLGFARIMQREQRQALDKSLSTQAFYAAESGVNDAIAKIHDPTANIPTKNTCSTTVGNSSGLDGSVDANLNASYSCLLINKAPKTLEYTQKSVTTKDSTLVPIRGAGDETISSVEVSWDDNSLTTPSFRPCPGTMLPDVAGWGNSPGILRFDLMPADGVLTRTGLINNMMTTFLYPNGTCGTTNVAYGSYIGSNAGRIVSIHCTLATTPHQCKAVITNVNLKYFFIRMRSVYDGSNVTIKIFDASNTQLAIKGAQVQIDSTGKVGDVVRRIQVRVPTNPTYKIPDYALETTLSICKQFSVVPNVSFTPSPLCAGY